MKIYQIEKSDFLGIMKDLESLRDKMYYKSNETKELSYKLYGIMQSLEECTYKGGNK